MLSKRKKRLSWQIGRIRWYFHDGFTHARRRRWVPFLDRRLKRRHFLVITMLDMRASDRAGSDNGDARKKLLKNQWTGVNYQSEINNRCIFFPRFPFFTYDVKTTIEPKQYWKSLPPDARKYYRDLYKSAQDTSAYNILYPPMCDRPVMDALAQITTDDLYHAITAYSILEAEEDDEDGPEEEFEDELEDEDGWGFGNHYPGSGPAEIGFARAMHLSQIRVEFSDASDVKSYTLSGQTRTPWFDLVHVEDNSQQAAVHPVDCVVDAVQLKIHSLHGADKGCYFTIYVEERQQEAGRNGGAGYA